MKLHLQLPLKNLILSSQTVTDITIFKQLKKKLETIDDFYLEMITKIF